MNNKQQHQNPFCRRLVTTPSLDDLKKMVSVAKKEIIIVSPWIKFKTLQKIIEATKSNGNINWKVLTRSNHDDFCVGSSDIEAFELMIENSSFDFKGNKTIACKGLYSR